MTEPRQIPVKAHTRKRPEPSWKSGAFADLPCGRCDAGVYDPHPFLVGLEMFKGCETRKQALAAAPLCKMDNSHICFGARDWIVSAEFPMTPEYVENLVKEMSA